MRLLLDTQAFIWADAAPANLSLRATTFFKDASNELFLSVASAWEMQIKTMLGKLTLQQPLSKLVQDWRQRSGLTVLDVRLEHVVRLETLPSLHSDPFDRLLIAQALVEGFTIISHYRRIAQYQVPVLW